MCSIFFFFSLVLKNTIFLFSDIYDAVDTYCSIGNKSPSSQFNHPAFTFTGSTLVNKMHFKTYILIINCKLDIKIIYLCIVSSFQRKHENVLSSTITSGGSRN